MPEEIVTPAIHIKDLTVIYNEKPVLWDVDLYIPQGCFMGIIGPNGAGKTTLLKSILGIVQPLAGQVLISGESVKQGKKRIGYVPQKQSIDWDFPVNVLEVVLMGTYKKIGWFSRPTKKEYRFALDKLEMLELETLAHRQIADLSGGQQQRVFIARALAQETDILIMDEPFQGIDAKTEKIIAGIFKELQKQGKTLLVVHHDLQTVREYFDRVTMVNVRLIASGKTEKSFTEQNLKYTYGGQIPFSMQIKP